MPPDHLVPLLDGRVLAVDEHGSPYGPVVLFLHAAPGSRVFDPDPAATMASGVRLLTIDRPGYGASTALPEGQVPRLVDFADDAIAVLDHLHIAAAVGVVGWSTGGLVALAVAAQHPHRTRRLALVATPAHGDDDTGLAEDYGDLITSLRPDPGSAPAVVAEALAPIAKLPSAVLDMVGSGGADAKVRADAARGKRLFAMARESLRQGTVGIAADIVASTIAPWGFDPRTVDRPVDLWYGEDDMLVAPEDGKYWADLLADAQLHRVPGAGHLLPLVAWGEILAKVG
jgi:pimeloyl-ACP methyl ester carboxylesterase